MPLSVVTCALLPLDSRPDEVLAIKYGLPVFWSTLVVFLATAFGA